MAFSGTSLLALLLAFCFLPFTLARPFDMPENSKREVSPAQIAKKQRPTPKTGYVNHETGHEENTPTHETKFAENNNKVMLPRADDVFFLPVLSNSVDNLLYTSELYLHDDDTLPSYLAQNGLPVGLLPSSVASYSITEDGKFTISLQDACYAKFDYDVYYAQTITGKLSYGTITDLSGIQAKQAFIWVYVTGVRTDGTSSEYIYFDSGPISKKLSISQFQTSPVCKVKAIVSSALA